MPSHFQQQQGQTAANSIAAAGDKACNCVLIKQAVQVAHVAIASVAWCTDLAAMAFGMQLQLPNRLHVRLPTLHCTCQQLQLECLVGCIICRWTPPCWA